MKFMILCTDVPFGLLSRALFSIFKLDAYSHLCSEIFNEDFVLQLPIKFLCDQHLFLV